MESGKAQHEERLSQLSTIMKNGENEGEGENEGVFVGDTLLFGEKVVLSLYRENWFCFIALPGKLVSPFPLPLRFVVILGCWVRVLDIIRREA